MIAGRGHDTIAEDNQPRYIRDCESMDAVMVMKNGATQPQRQGVQQL
jgi:hypothetical protein